jgi:fumarylacetoacetase
MWEIEANNPKLRTWLDVPEGSDFPIQNIPFGIAFSGESSPFPVSRIGDTIINLSALADYGYFNGIGINDLSVFNMPVLNPLIGLGRLAWRAVRERISEIFRLESPDLRENKKALDKVIKHASVVKILMPVKPTDYTDFYSSEQHAVNMGQLFREGKEGLMSNWKYMPVGYHGRVSSIVVSGTPVHRPKGQFRSGSAEYPEFGPTRELDFELEVAFVIGKSTRLGEAVRISDAEDHIFGLLLFNDLSARDIQRWEYQPLGPFLGKNFGSVISPWIITMEALEGFRVNGPAQDPGVLEYLSFEGKNNFDISLEVFIQPEDQKPVRCSGSNFKYIYWNIYQQLAHHTVNGCSINIGDIYASGAISGPEPGSFGSMIELTWKGSRPIQMPDGTSRIFLHDKDSVIIKGFAEKDGIRIGFGECKTKILPAK